MTEPCLRALPGNTARWSSPVSAGAGVGGPCSFSGTSAMIPGESQVDRRAGGALFQGRCRARESHPPGAHGPFAMGRGGWRFPQSDGDDDRSITSVCPTREMSCLVRCIPRVLGGVDDERFSGDRFNDRKCGQPTGKRPVMRPSSPSPDISRRVADGAGTAVFTGWRRKRMLVG